MCRKTSALNKVAFTILVIGSIMAVVGFGAPFWVKIPDTWSMMMWDKVTYRGLWSMCCPDNSQTGGYSCVSITKDYYALEQKLPPCTWIWNKDGMKTENLPAWYKAAEAVYCLAIVFLSLSIVLQCIYACCSWCENTTKVPTAVGSAAFAGGSFSGLAMAIYGGSAYNDNYFTPSLAGGLDGQLEWAFYVGVAASGICIVAAVFFFIDGCKQKKPYKGYDFKSPVLGTQHSNC